MSELTTRQIMEKLYHSGEYDECMEFHEFVNRFGPAIIERYEQKKEAEHNDL